MTLPGSPALRAKYASYCALTCLGGSEKKQCLCNAPVDCEMQHEPTFGLAREEAKARMFHYVQRRIDE